MIENQDIEFKAVWKDEYLKWICGMANANGGIIYIGKDDKGNVIGINNAVKLVKEIPNKIKDTMGIIPEVKVEEENDLLCIVIKIDNYPMPISYQGKFYLRSGSNNHEVTGTELDKFMLDRVGKRWEDLPVKNATFDDLNEEAFKIFKEKAVKSGRLKSEFEKHYSKPYNPLIAQTFFKAGFIESWGRGFEKIKKECELNNTPIPEIEIKTSGVMVKCNASPIYMDLLEEMRVKNVQINVYKNVQINDYEKLTKIEKEILEIIIENPEIPQVNIANRLGTSPKTVQRGIATLKTKGIIERVGSNKKGYWEIKK